MPSIRTEVRDYSLTIFRTYNRYRNVKKLQVTVYCQTLPQVFFVSGASRLTCSESIKTESLSFDCSGAGRIHFNNLESENLSLVITGASSVDITGKAETVFIQAEGASKLQASNFVTDVCEARISGASHAELGNIGKELSVSASGASHFGYRGTPVIKKQDISGASKVNAR
jgi:hypothetical protein